MDENKLRKRIFNIIMESTVAKDPTNFLPIDTPINSADYKLFAGIVNQGIDSHLEGFTKSKFEKSSNGRFLFNFSKSEIPILLRRLKEEGTEEADSWAEDIENSLAVNINEDEDIDNDDNLDITGSSFDLNTQFNLPTDIDYDPTKEDIEDIEKTWGKGNYINKPMDDQERNTLFKTMSNTSNEDLEQIQKDLEMEKDKSKGGYINKKMKKFGSSAN